MPTLDPFTIMLMTTLTCGAMSVVMFSLHGGFRREVDGMGHWALGLLLMVVAASLFTLRDAMPDMFFLVANGVLICGVGLGMVGTEKFYGQAPSWRLFGVLWLLCMAGCAWWLLVTPSFSARLSWFSLLVSIFYGRQMVLVLRHGERHFSSYFFGLMMLLQTILVLLRCLFGLSADVSGIFMRDRDGMLSFYLAATNFMSLLLAASFITVATRRLQSILERRATHDPLTQVLNRRGFDEVYGAAKAMARRKSQPLTLMSIDLDFFKSVNDRFGHAMGDRVLVHVAQIIAGALRESDHVARFGGEEFIVLLPDMTLERAVGVAERICVSLRESNKPGLPPCTVSIGAACHLTLEETLDQLVERADAAMYRAKGNGRDRVETAPQVMPDKTGMTCGA